MQTNRAAGAFSAGELPDGQSFRHSSRWATWRSGGGLARVVLAAGVAAAAMLGVGCGSQPTPPASTGSMADVAAMRDHYQKMTPDARVGTVDAVRSDSHWIGISDPQADKYKPGETVSVLVGPSQYVTGTVQQVIDGTVIARYEDPAAGLRAPQKGDVAVYIPPEGPGGGKLGSDMKPAAPASGMPAPTTPAPTVPVPTTPVPTVPGTPGGPAMPDPATPTVPATPTPATPTPAAPGTPAAPATPEVPAIPAPTTPPSAPSPSTPPPTVPEVPATPAVPAPAPTTPVPEVPAAPAMPAPAIPAPEPAVPTPTPAPTPAPDGK